ncbi:MAG TPA: tetratricopeptide repeat protein [Chitinophagaceae bacterium]|nr:tetratricopeptide repeat protein [Chitinophagaceae bacterium]
MRNSFFLLLFPSFIFSCDNDRGSHLLAGKSYAERFAFFDSVGAIKEKGYAFIDSLDRLNSDKFKDKLTLQTALATIRYSVNRYDMSSSKEAFFMAAVEKAKDKKWNKLYAEALEQLGSYTWVTLGDKNKALQYYHRAYLVYHSFDPREFPIKFLCLSEYAGAYYSFEQYDKAIAFLSEAIQLGDYKPDRGSFISGWNTLGLCYRAKGEYEKALEIFNDVLAYTEKYNEDTWRTIVRGNIGTVYHFLNKPERASPLLEEEVIRGITEPDWKAASSAQLYLAEIELNAGNLSLAAGSIHKARDYSIKVKLERTNSKVLKRIFDDLALVYRMSGDYRLSLLYTDSARIVNDSIQKKLGANILLNAQNQIDLANFNEEKKTTERINNYVRNMLIGGIVLLGITSLLFIRRQQIKHSQRQKQVQAEKKKMENELKAATQELHHFARSLEEKNAIIEKIQLLQTTKQQDEEKYELLSKLEKSVLLTDEQWNEFTSLFEKVYGNFFLRLKDKVPAISPAEIRIIALGKLKLSNKTMAGMLGITPDAVRMNKFRIRKKLNLEEEAEFEKFLQSV